MGILQKIFQRGLAQRETPAQPQREVGLRDGERISDKYTVRALLGRGGMGEVYLVEDTEQGKIRAAKLMRAREQASVAELQAFRREALALLDVGTHPFLVRLYEVHEHGRDTLLIMEYVPPENGCTSLQETIQRTTDYTDSILGVWAVEFCVGMEHALKCGIQAHRDIKPANLLVGASPFLKISDFGLALAAERHLTAIRSRSAPLVALQQLHSLDGRATCGTPGYIAPEILSGERASALSDMFSFGVTLWQLAARSLQMPFDVQFAGDVDAFQQSILREASARRVRRLDSPFFEVIRRCIDPDPQKRYEGFPALREDLKSASKRHNLQAMDFIIKPGFIGTFEEYVARARAYLVLGRRGRALRILNKALEIDPRSQAALCARGDVYLEMRDLNALRDFRDAHEIDTDSDAPMVGMARALLLDGRIASAESVLKVVLARHPDNLEAQVEAAYALCATDRADEALTSVEQVLKKIPDYALAHEYRARFLWSKHDYQGATEELLYVLSVEPMRVWAGLALAAVAHDCGDQVAESLAYDRIVHLFISEPEVLNQIAIQMAERGQAKRGIELFDMVAELGNGPEDKAVSLINKGNALANLKDHEGARRQFEQALRLDAGSALAQYRLGDWEAEQGDIKRATTFYAAACKLEPHNPRYHASVGTAFLRQGDYVRAAQHLKRSVELYAEQPHIHYNLAATLVSQGDGEGALQHLSNAVTHDRRYGRGWYLKAQIESQMGQSSDAVISLRNALNCADTLDAKELDGLHVLARRYKVEG